MSNFELASIEHNNNNNNNNNNNSNDNDIDNDNDNDNDNNNNNNNSFIEVLNVFIFCNELGPPSTKKVKLFTIK